MKLPRKFSTSGFIRLQFEPGAEISMGRNIRVNSGPLVNPVGGAQKLHIKVRNGATLTIGDNVGMSNCVIVCWNSVKIGAHSFIGGGVCIYDTDFHPVISHDRNQGKPAASKPVTIGRNVFIGGHTIILKGVTIGDGAVVGAGSLVTRDIPQGELWGGNPVKFIKKIGTDHGQDQQNTNHSH